MKSAHIQSFFGPYFSAFGQNMQRLSPNDGIRTRKTSNMDTFHAVHIILELLWFNHVPPLFLQLFCMRWN